MSVSWWSPRKRRVGFSAGRSLVLLAALAGLFAMHGMSDHGMSHGNMADGVLSSSNAHLAMSPVSPMSPMAVGASAVAAGAVEAASEAASEAVPDAGMALAMGLCLAVLAGVVVLLLGASGRWWSAGLVRAILARPRAWSPAGARDPDPPDLFALSIQRC